jgi:hypothetical protein
MNIEDWEAAALHEIVATIEREAAARGARVVGSELVGLMPAGAAAAAAGAILRIDGFDADESDALIEELTGYMIQPEGQYRHRWEKGDVVIWDNRCSYHRAAGDYPPDEDRIHWRVSIKERYE